jgi:hypothetical protein
VTIRLLGTRLTTSSTHLEADRVVARSGVRVLTHDEVYGAYKGVSESVPPGGGGSLVAAAPLQTLPRAFAFPPQLFGGARRRQILGFNNLYCSESVFFCAHGPVSTSCCGHELGMSERGSG